MAKQDSSVGRAWYAIHTYAGYENAVARNLRQRIESLGLQDKIFNVVVPTEHTVKIKGGRRVEEEEKVYEGDHLVTPKKATRNSSSSTLVMTPNNDATTPSTPPSTPAMLSSPQFVHTPKTPSVFDTSTWTFCGMFASNQQLTNDNSIRKRPPKKKSLWDTVQTRISELSDPETQFAYLI